MPKLLEPALIALDSETTGKDLRHGAKPFFVTVAHEDGTQEYWEADVDPLTRQPQWSKTDLTELAGVVCSNKFYNFVLQNPKFDVQALHTIIPEATWDWPCAWDTLLAGHVLASNQPHDLTSMAMVYLRTNIKPFEDALEIATKEAMKIAKHQYKGWQLAKAGRTDMPSAKEKTWKYDSWLPRAIAKHEGYPQDHPWWTVLANYSNTDSAVTLALFKRQCELLKAKGLWRIYLERLKVLPVIASMESYGTTMSAERTNKVETQLTEEAEHHREVCLKAADYEIEDLPVNGVSNDLRYVVFEKFGLVSSKKTKQAGNPSMDKFVLDHWIATLPEGKPRTFIESLKAYRKRKTGLSYIESYRKFWLPLQEHTFIQKPGQPRSNGSQWRIVYPSFNPTGTDTLRFSSQNPNAQQVSKQEDSNLRYCFGPAPGREWWARDAKNIELRLPAYEAGEEEMIALFERPDDPPYYGSYHMLVFDVLHPEKFAKYGKKCKDEYASTWYQWTKNGNFAVQYGAVEQSGTADRAYHVKGAQKKIQNRFGKIKALNELQIEFARKHGYVETMPDKTVDPSRGYPLYCGRTMWGDIMPTVPLNYHIQGTAMWWMMKAMIRCHAYLEQLRSKGVDAYIILQVHDELVFDFPKGKGKAHMPMITKLMEQGGDDIGVPTPVSCTYHPVSWKEGESL